jgi:putative NADH-flavin reductase
MDAVDTAIVEEGEPRLPHWSSFPLKVKSRWSSLVPQSRPGKNNHPQKQKMRIAVFGITGGVGAQFQKILSDPKVTALGHEFVLVARNPSKVPPLPRCTVVKGDVTDAASVSSAIRGADIVTTMYGQSKAGTSSADTQQVGVRNIIAAMKEHSVRRLVYLGTGLAPDTTDAWGWVDGSIYGLVSRTILSTPAADAIKAKVYLEESAGAAGVDYVFLRPALLDGIDDNLKKGAYRLGGYNVGSGSAATKISRADVAGALWDMTIQPALFDQVRLACFGVCVLCDPHSVAGREY